MKKTAVLFAMFLLCTAVLAAETILPRELQNADRTKIFQMKPARGKFSVEDKDAESGYASRKIYPADYSFGEHLAVSYLMPKHAVKWGKGPKIKYTDLPAGQYRWVKWGTNAVVPGTTLVLNNDWGKALDFRNVDAVCPDKGRKYTMFLRLKIQGPAFKQNSGLKENSISLDKIVFSEQ